MTFLRALRGRRALLPRRLRASVAVACGAGALAAAAFGGSAPAQVDGPDVRPPPDAGRLAAGRRLFADTCSSCHGDDARGVPGRGPSLRGAGAASADFYLRTGRMPLADPHDQPVRADSPFTREERQALVAYVGSFGGPPIPSVHPARGDLSDGFEAYTENCAGCHQVVGQGGIVTHGTVPDLQAASAVDVAEAIEVGPYLMPRFRKLSDAQVDSIARYVAYTHDPRDEGGWSIGHIGPIPEGMVAWLLAGLALVLTIRLIGERTE
jgi:quinol---cytochrome-c reductase cytochrome c subunit